MRVENTAPSEAENSSPSNFVQNQGGASAVQSQSAPAVSNGATAPAQDFVQLSSASSLVELAKGMMPANKTAKFNQVSALVRGGEYRPSFSSISQALVQGHL